MPNTQVIKSGANANIGAGGFSSSAKSIGSGVALYQGATLISSISGSGGAGSAGVGDVISGITVVSTSGGYVSSINAGASAPLGVGYTFVSNGSITVQETTTPFDIVAASNAPTGLTATQVGNKVTLSWANPNSGVPTSFNIYRYIGTNPPALVTNIAYGTNSFDDYGRAIGKTYSYYVVGVFSGTGEGTTSNTATVAYTGTIGATSMLKSKKLRGVQLGFETVMGTQVAASILIPNMTLNPPKRQNNTKKVDAEGWKNATGQQRGHRWSEWSATGALSYAVMPYWASMLIMAGVTPTTVGTTGKKRTFIMSNRNVDTPQTATFEYGNNQGSNDSFAFGTMSDFSLALSNSAADFTIGGFGYYPTKNITMTSSPTQVARNYANMSDFRVNFASTFGGLATGKLLTVKSFGLDVKSKYKSQFFIDDATDSIGGILELKPAITGKIVVAEGTESDTFLAALETNSLNYIQLQGTGPLIETGTPNVYNSMKLTLPIYVNNEDETDDDDLFAGSYDFFAGDDGTNGDFIVETVTTQVTL